MLVKLVSGASVNPDTLSTFTLNKRRSVARKLGLYSSNLDDNTIHPIAYFGSKNEAIDCVKQCVQSIIATNVIYPHRII